MRRNSFYWDCGNAITGLAVALFPMIAMADPLPAKPPVPKDNPMTPAKIELGKKLYFDPRISVDGTISCNSCHNVMAGGDDARPVSVGVRGQKGARSAPTVWNSAFMSVQFWDGRAPSLEKQAEGPMINAVEMGSSSHDLVVGRIQKSIRRVEARECGRTNYTRPDDEGDCRV